MTIHAHYNHAAAADDVNKLVVFPSIKTPSIIIKTITATTMQHTMVCSGAQPHCVLVASPHRHAHAILRPQPLHSRRTMQRCRAAESKVDRAVYTGHEAEQSNPSHRRTSQTRSWPSRSSWCAAIAAPCMPSTTTPQALKKKKKGPKVVAPLVDATRSGQPTVC